MDNNEMLEIFGHMLNVQGKFSETFGKIVEMLVPLAQTKQIEMEKLEDVLHIVDEANATLDGLSEILQRRVAEAGA